MRFNIAHGFCYRSKDKFVPGHVCGNKEVDMIIVDDADLVESRTENKVDVMEGVLIEHKSINADKDIWFVVHVATGSKLGALLSLMARKFLFVRWTQHSVS